MEKRRFRAKSLSIPRLKAIMESDSEVYRFVDLVFTLKEKVIEYERQGGDPAYVERANEEAEAIITEMSESYHDYLKFSEEIADAVRASLAKQNMTQRDLADKLLKNEPEVSKWLTGKHNFTLRSLVALEKALGERILFTKRPEAIQSKQVLVNIQMVNQNKPRQKTDFEFESYYLDNGFVKTHQPAYA